MAKRPQDPAPPRRRAYKLTAIAEALDVSFATVDRLVRAGKLPVFRLPSGVRRVADEDFDRVLEEWKAESR